MNAIQTYCLKHSTQPSIHCQAIAEYTEKHVPQSLMVSGPLVGSLLGFFVEWTKAQRVLEFGCFTGYSALCMAERLPEGGELITLDINPDTAALAKRFWSDSPHGSKIRALIGPADETSAHLRGPFDLIFIDADKPGYCNYLNIALELLSPRGLIIADNCLYFDKVIEENPAEENARAIKRFNDYVSSHAMLNSVLLPVRDGLRLVWKKTEAGHL